MYIGEYMLILCESSEINEKKVRNY